MNRNPLIPFVLIMVFGIGLVSFLSAIGLNDLNEAENGSEEVVVLEPEERYQQSCISCHGQNFEGGAGPSLLGVGERYSNEEIQDILLNGKEGGMPAGLVPQEELEPFVEWLSSLE
ncbi:cytochrome c550 [Bacillus fonticola]|uniref:cytochrome c550 n=1 Tax=Bacillus fonticola TaxID=2728853 RepID=UPI00147344FB|nr:cytochrome c [Bacillus fonticola]